MLRYLFRRANVQTPHHYYMMWKAKRNADELQRAEYYLGIKVV